MSSLIPNNLSVIINNKINNKNNLEKKSEFNCNAKEFVPQEKTKNPFLKNKLEKIYENKFENFMFDNLESDFIKNNEWLFFH